MKATRRFPAMGLNIATRKWLNDRGFRPVKVPGALNGFWRLRKKSRLGLWTTIFAKPGEMKADIVKRGEAVALDV